jgi:hypothetical protein
MKAAMQKKPKDEPSQEESTQAAEPEKEESPREATADETEKRRAALQATIKKQEAVPKLDLSAVPAPVTPTSSPRKDSPTSFNLAELDQIINLELRTASDQPKYSRKDALKVRYYVLDQV